MGWRSAVEVWREEGKRRQGLADRCEHFRTIPHSFGVRLQTVPATSSLKQTLFQCLGVCLSKYCDHGEATGWGRT